MNTAPTIWTPQDYGIPPSPPALQRQKRKRETERLLREAASYTGRLAFPGYHGWLPALLAAGDLAGNTQVLDGLGMKTYGNPVPAVFANAVAHWMMEEATGTPRLDSTGRGNTQLDTGSVNQSATHKIGSFSAGNNYVTAVTYLSCAGTDLNLPAGQAYTFNLWVYLSTLQLLNVVFGKGSATFNSPIYRIHVANAGINQFAFTVKSASSSRQIFEGTNITGATWYMLTCANDPANNQIWVTVNNAALTTGALTSGGDTSAGAMFIGVPETNAHPAFLPLQGYVDSFTCFNVTLTTGNIATLYNSGAGLDY